VQDFALGSMRFCVKSSSEAGRTFCEANCVTAAHLKHNTVLQMQLTFAALHLTQRCSTRRNMTVEKIQTELLNH
jgi:hypothetical protein